MFLIAVVLMGLRTRFESDLIGDCSSCGLDAVPAAPPVVAAAAPPAAAVVAPPVVPPAVAVPPAAAAIVAVACAACVMAMLFTMFCRLS